MSSAAQAPTITAFDPSSFKTFRFIDRMLEADGTVRLRYGLDELEFEETFTLPLPAAGVQTPPQTLDGILDLLHWVTGVSYYKAAIPPTIVFEGNQPGPATLALLTALYTEGLGEFAVVNDLPDLPRPTFSDGARGSNNTTLSCGNRPAEVTGDQLRRLLVPVGGGKDSAVAIEIARRSGLDVTLFSIGDATPIHETARVSGYDKLTATRKIDPLLLEANAAGALNGHIPVTAIVSSVALLTAALNGQDAVALANERSASAGTMIWHGIEVNHQFSKSLRVERLLSAAVDEIPDAPAIFSILRPASELAIARAFARFTEYHPVFTSCNRVFKLDPAQRATSWCCDCDKCRFVFLILAPFMTPGHLTGILGQDLLDDPQQYEGFALLTASGGEKPFECVGEVDECLAAIRLLSEDPRWRDHAVVKRLGVEIPAVAQTTEAQIGEHFALSSDHNVPAELMGAVNEVLGA